MTGTEGKFMSRTTKFWIAVVVFLAVIVIWYATSRFQPVPGELPVIAITQIATHPALDEVREGIVAGLKMRGYEDKSQVAIIFRNANGDASLTVPIAEDFVRRRPAVIVPISTPSTLAVLKSTKEIPIVFSGVADPKGSGIVANFEHPGGNITGVCDDWPFEDQVRVFLDSFPKTKRIGMLYTKGDSVSQIGVEALTTLAPKMGFELELVPVSAAQDIYPAAVALLPRVDTVFTGIDHLILENMDGLAKAAEEANKPLFGGETGSVEKGAVLALSIDMTEFGDTTAELIVQVLKGANPGDLPVRVVTTGKLYFNRKAAEKFGIDVDAMKAKGARVIEKSKP